MVVLFCWRRPITKLGPHRHKTRGFTTFSIKQRKHHHRSLQHLSHNSPLLLPHRCRHETLNSLDRFVPRLRLLVRNMMSSNDDSMNSARKERSVGDDMSASSKPESTRFKWERVASVAATSSQGSFSLPVAGRGHWCPTRGEFDVPANFDYARSTIANYSAAPKDWKRCYGDFKEVRATRDFEYHGTYTKDRQLFQGL